MKNERKMLSPVIEIVLGAALIIISKLFDLDSVWVGMGSALIAVGTVQFLNLLRYRQDADYREKVDTEAHDERNQFIRAPAQHISRPEGRAGGLLPNPEAVPECR